MGAIHYNRCGALSHVCELGEEFSSVCWDWMLPQGSSVLRSAVLNTSYQLPRCSELPLHPRGILASWVWNQLAGFLETLSISMADAMLSSMDHHRSVAPPPSRRTGGARRGLRDGGRLRVPSSKTNPGSETPAAATVDEVGDVRLEFGDDPESFMLASSHLLRLVSRVFTCFRVA